MLKNTTDQARSHGATFGGSAPQTFVVARKICFKHIIKTNILPSWQCISPQTVQPSYGPAAEHFADPITTQSCLKLDNGWTSGIFRSCIKTRHGVIISRNRLHCQFNRNRPLLSRLNFEIFNLHHCAPNHAFWWLNFFLCHRSLLLCFREGY